MLLPVLSLWNWKSAVLSAAIRASIFFAVNLRAGRTAAVAAFSTEIVLRLITSGFYGGVTQACGRLEPEWKGLLVAVITLPLMSHGLEFIVHYWRGTPELALSIAASVAFTIVSTMFNVFAMRRGAYTTGAGSQSLRDDFRQTPRLVVSFMHGLVRIVRTSVAWTSGATNPRQT